jgi:hypothetical protein
MKGYRNWLPLLYFFINAAVVNAYRIQYIYKQQQGSIRLPAQLFFRERLYQQLFAFAAQANTGLPNERLNKALMHCRIQLNSRQTCAWCHYIKKRDQVKSSRASRTYSGCSACGNIALCLKTRCWELFHSLPN